MENKEVRVIVADDHTLLRQGLVKLLELSEGIKVIDEATNGEEAVRKVADLQPDVVLMDVNMPKLNGIDATRLIRNQLPKMPILALTIHDDEEYISEMIRAGARGYLLKDSEPSSVIQAIERVVAGESYFPSYLMEKVMQKFYQLVQESEKTVAQQDYILEQGDLTTRELEVVQCIVKGMSNKEIASHLFISEKTVKNHITNVLRKLDLADRTQVAVYAVQNRILKAEG